MEAAAMRRQVQFYGDIIAKLKRAGVLKGKRYSEPHDTPVRELRATAYREAIAMLEVSCDNVDLPQTLSEKDESWVREYIRTVITAKLQKAGGT